jgi:prepilin-type N-terminal cleavage/methylation domain-containing protein
MAPALERRPSAGFSLAELLVGLLLVSIAALAAAPLFVQAMHGNAASRDLGWVVAAAERRFELLRQARFDSLVPGGSLTADVPGYCDTAAGVVVRWIVADHSAAIPQTKQITLRASRQRVGYGPAGTVTLITLRGD